MIRVNIVGVEEDYVLDHIAQYITAIEGSFGDVIVTVQDERNYEFMFNAIRNINNNHNWVVNRSGNSRELRIQAPNAGVPVNVPNAPAARSSAIFGCLYNAL